ncbi:MAG: FtsH protease activity modulator HflK [Candidatus Saccharibacteria bacterium]|nr:FtsH protease activity modulator HflK [Pseudorhodobacter sp.]
MAGSGGPWGGGGDGPDDKNKGQDDRRNGGDRRGQQLPDVDQLMRKGQEQLRVLMGGKGNGGGGNNGRGDGPANIFTRQNVFFGIIGLVLFWAYMSFYQLKPEERSVELMFGKFSSIGEEGLNFAPWPFVTAEVLNTTRQNTTAIGTGAGGAEDNGLMLTSDQNIVDIEFEVVWIINDPTKYLFNLKDPEGTIKAVAESSVRDIAARSQLMPILNTERGAIGNVLEEEIQATLQSYDSGITVVRVNLLKSDAPEEVKDSFRAVQAAQQERDRLQKEADAYANKVTAQARGNAAQTAEQAKAYSTQVVNVAEGDASRFTSIFGEYVKAPEVTRQRLYLETMEQVLGGMKKIITEGGSTQGVVPYLPLNELIAAPAKGVTN